MSEYVPSEEYVRESYVYGASEWQEPCEKEREFDRFLARVRRDAARAALDGLAATHDAQVLADFGIRNSSRIGQEARIYRDTHYPQTGE